MIENNLYNNGLEEVNGQQTGDVRDIRERLEGEMPDVALGDGPRKVDVTDDKKVNDFYNEY